jgi:hypothetical protein
MRRITLGSRWSTPRQQYSGNWSQNPWINAVSRNSQARSEAAGHATQDWQQQAAIGVWEDDGGSIRTDCDVRR